MQFYDRYKSTINVVALVGASAAAYAIYKNFQRKQDEADAFRQKSMIEGEVAALINQGFESSFAESEYFNMADGLVQAMSGCGKDFSKVLYILGRLRNELDYLKLHLAFGLRYYEPCFWHSPWQLLVYQFNDKAYGGDLAAWLYYDLSTDQLKQVNDVMLSHGVGEITFE